MQSPGMQRAAGVVLTVTLFVLLLTAFVILTITCIWFRGAEMKLVWPW